MEIQIGKVFKLYCVVVSDLSKSVLRSSQFRHHDKRYVYLETEKGEKQSPKLGSLPSDVSNKLACIKTAGITDNSQKLYMYLVSSNNLNTNLHAILIRTSKLWPSLIVRNFLGNFSLNCSYAVLIFKSTR